MSVLDTYPGDSDISWEACKTTQLPSLSVTLLKFFCYCLTWKRFSLSQAQWHFWGPWRFHGCKCRELLFSPLHFSYCWQKKMYYYFFKFLCHPSQKPGADPVIAFSGNTLFCPPANHIVQPIPDYVQVRSCCTDAELRVGVGDFMWGHSGFWLYGFEATFTIVCPKARALLHEVPQCNDVTSTWHLHVGDVTCSDVAPPPTAPSHQCNEITWLSYLNLLILKKIRVFSSNLERPLPSMYN